ncbi:MAG: hypothetical protein H0T60_18695 [Acidobacteria bacterium]|nr:hypothetical protein [Acidobacteriota bacterium]
MGAFVDYLDLRLAVADLVKSRNITDVMRRLTLTAESRLDSDLRTRHQITDGVVTFTGGTGTLPANFLEMINVYGVSNYLLRSGPLSDARRSGSMFYRYTISGTSIYIQGYTGGRDIQYYARIPTLTTSDATTNWLLERYPNVYLYAIGLEAAIHLQDMERAELITGQLEIAKRAIMTDDERARYSNASVRVQGMTP